MAKFVHRCHVCLHFKDLIYRSIGGLYPLPIHTGKFLDYSLKIVADLLLTAGCNAIVSIVDWLTKWSLLFLAT